MYINLKNQMLGELIINNNNNNNNNCLTSSRGLLDIHKIQ